MKFNKRRKYSIHLHSSKRIWDDEGRNQYTPACIRDFIADHEYEIEMQIEGLTLLAAMEWSCACSDIRVTSTYYYEMEE